MPDQVGPGVERPGVQRPSFEPPGVQRPGVQRPDVDVAIVGGGGAGLTLLHQLAVHGPAGLRVAVIDPVDRLRDQPSDRTWCFWDEGTSEVEPALHRSWSAVQVISPDGRARRLDLSPMRYAMVRSQDLYAVVSQLISRLDVRVVREAVVEVVDRADGAVVVTPSTELSATHVFDSRPAAPLRPALTTLLQHFHGVTVRAAYDVFDPDLPTLMDFRTPQPEVGLSFGYCLPSSGSQALVEYTEFSPAVLDDEGYRQAIGGYLSLAMGGHSVPHEVGHQERGVIPMSDAQFARRVGRHVYRLGTAGGATRASTGYTFAAMLRQGGSVARAIGRGQDPVPPAAYPRRHLLLDGIFLRALADGSLSGPAFFTRLFARNPPARVLAFLDGRAGLAADLHVVASAPWTPMLRSAAYDTAARARRRLRGTG